MKEDAYELEQHTLFGESFLEQNRVTAATVQRYTTTLNEFLAFTKMSMDEILLLAKLDEMVVEMLENLYFQGYGHGAGDYLMAAVKFVGWIQSVSDLPRAVRTNVFLFFFMTPNQREVTLCQQHLRRELKPERHLVKEQKSTVRRCVTSSTFWLVGDRSRTRTRGTTQMPQHDWHSEWLL